MRIGREHRKALLFQWTGWLIHFDNARYQQFKDKIGHYTHLDHNDTKRREHWLTYHRIQIMPDLRVRLRLCQELFRHLVVTPTPS